MCMCGWVCGCVLVTQLCPTICDPMDYSPLGSSVHGISQARILELVAISFSRGFSWSRDQPTSALAGRLFSTEPPGKPSSSLWITIETPLILFICSPRDRRFFVQLHIGLPTVKHPSAESIKKMLDQPHVAKGFFQNCIWGSPLAPYSACLALGPMESLTHPCFY